LDRSIAILRWTRIRRKRPFSICDAAAPNITGVLTLGHVLNNSIQDILARRGADAGFRSALVAGDGSRRNWNPDPAVEKVAP